MSHDIRATFLTKKNEIELIMIIIIIRTISDDQISYGYAIM